MKLTNWRHQIAPLGLVSSDLQRALERGQVQLWLSEKDHVSQSELQDRDWVVSFQDNFGLGKNINKGSRPFDESDLGTVEQRKPAIYYIYIHTPYIHHIYIYHISYISYIYTIIIYRYITPSTLYNHVLCGEVSQLMGASSHRYARWDATPGQPGHAANHRQLAATRWGGFYEEISKPWINK